VQLDAAAGVGRFAHDADEALELAENDAHRLNGDGWRDRKKEDEKKRVSEKHQISPHVILRKFKTQQKQTSPDTNIVQFFIFVVCVLKTDDYSARC
jgi:hypothetical protein